MALALVYRGPASSPGCPEALAVLLAGAGLQVRYVGPHEPLKLVGSSFVGAALYAQPGGGDVDSAMRALGSAGARYIRDYVQYGGRYLGTCLGGYMAGENPGIGLLAPGDTDQYCTTNGASVTTTDPAVIPVRWRDHDRLMWVQDPPYLIPSNQPGEQILARYSNGLPAALIKPYGRGKVAVCGPHPEAGRSWYSDDLWAQAGSTAADLGEDLIRTLMR